MENIYIKINGEYKKIIDSKTAAEILGRTLNDFHKYLSNGKYPFTEIRIKNLRMFIEAEVWDFKNKLAQ